MILDPFMSKGDYIRMCLCVSAYVCFTAPYLVLLQTALLNHLVALLLEGDDDQSHENVDKEEWEDHEVNHIEHRHLHSISPTRPHVLLCYISRVLQDSSSIKKKNKENTKNCCLGENWVFPVISSWP